MKVVDHPYQWDYAGTAGAFIAAERVRFTTLSTAGLRVFAVDVGR